MILILTLLVSLVIKLTKLNTMMLHDAACILEEQRSLAGVAPFQDPDYRLWQVRAYESPEVRRCSTSVQLFCSTRACWLRPAAYTVVRRRRNVISHNCNLNLYSRRADSLTWLHSVSAAG